MACNNNLTNLDNGQAFRRTFDCEHDAIRIVQAVDSVMEMELSAADGDSVQALPKTLLQENGNSLDCSDYRTACLYIKCSAFEGEGALASLEVSPVIEGDVWMSVGSIVCVSNSMVRLAPVSLHAKRVRASCAQAEASLKLICQS